MYEIKTPPGMTYQFLTAYKILRVQNGTDWITLDIPFEAEADVEYKIDLPEKEGQFDPNGKVAISRV